MTKHIKNNHNNLDVATQLSLDSRRLCDRSKLLMGKSEILQQRSERAKLLPKSLRDASARTEPYFSMTEPPDSEERIGSETSTRAMTSADKFLTLTLNKLGVIT